MIYQDRIQIRANDNPSLWWALKIHDLLVDEAEHYQFYDGIKTIIDYSAWVDRPMHDAVKMYFASEYHRSMSLREFLDRVFQ